MQGPICPVPIQHDKTIVMGHGSGGKMSLDLITKHFLPPFDNPSLRAGDDAGVVKIPLEHTEQRIAISTDSHVVWPLFFQGGDIGRLAICGTVNDVSMMGANPQYITVGFILEEGLDFEVLNSVVLSMKEAALEAGVEIIAGDTKVVQRGKADGLYINTTGIGLIPRGINISGANAQPGDVVIISGTIGDHGIAVLSARGDLGFEADVKSDVAPLNHLVNAILATNADIHVLRDPTRGGVATSLNEISRQSHVGIRIYEDRLPILPPVNSACEMLGFDPLYIANEGKLLAIVPPEDADVVLKTLQNMDYGKDSVVIGEVIEDPKGIVLMQTSIGSSRIIDIPSGEILPRIC